MVEFLMPTCEKLVQELYALRRDVLAIIGSGGGADAAGHRFDRLIGRYEE